jgi:hypothetical protein
MLAVDATALRRCSSHLAAYEAAGRPTAHVARSSTGFRSAERLALLRGEQWRLAAASTCQQARSLVAQRRTTVECPRTKGRSAVSARLDTAQLPRQRSEPAQSSRH